jgi:hypothetical protein
LISGSSSKIISKNGKNQLSTKVKISSELLSSKDKENNYTPSISPVKDEFSMIERRFKERKINRLKKEKKEKLRNLRESSNKKN